MKAAQIQRFGPPGVITIDDLPRPEPGADELLVPVKMAGVGHWDALVREGKVHEPLPLILGRSYQESSKRSEWKSRGSRLATKYIHGVSRPAADRVAWGVGALGAAVALTITFAQLSVHGFT